MLTDLFAVKMYKNTKNDKKIDIILKILYLIFDYPHKHYTFKYFAV